jgi:hypothetical protein
MATNIEPLMVGRLLEQVRDKATCITVPSPFLDPWTYCQSMQMVFD